MTDGTETGSAELPPPTGPPAGESAPASSAPFWANWELPFGTAREAAEWWFGPLVASRSWIGFAYLLAGAILGVIRFVVVVVMLSVSLPLIIVGVGIPLTVLSFTAINGIATLERRRAAWVGEPIVPRPFAASSGPWWRRMLIGLGDPTRWRQVAFFMASLVVAPVLLAVAVLPLAALVQSVSSVVSGAGFVGLTGLLDVGGIAVAILMAGLAGRAAVFVAGIERSYVAWFLGPDPTAALEARVDTLAEQRDDILEAVAAERRRIERNLHDGVQQQLVAIGIDIGRARARIDEDPESARELLDEARDKVRGSVGELRMIGRGLHPAVLGDRGLDAALSSIVASSPIPIDVRVEVDGAIPAGVAETAYYVANEAVANVLKHAGARAASIRVVELRRPLPVLSLSVHDDGCGGASFSNGGSGLAGMAARVRGADGWFSVDSPVGGPTVVTALIPLAEGGGDD